jgi:hypothetical protein
MPKKTKKKKGKRKNGIAPTAAQPQRTVKAVVADRGRCWMLPGGPGAWAIGQAWCGARTPA